jgi:hypothetical protein
MRRAGRSLLSGRGLARGSASRRCTCVRLASAAVGCAKTSATGSPSVPAWVADAAFETGGLCCSRRGIAMGGSRCSWVLGSLSAESKLGSGTRALPLEAASPGPGPLTCAGIRPFMRKPRAPRRSAARRRRQAERSQDPALLQPPSLMVPPRGTAHGGSSDRTRGSTYGFSGCNTALRQRRAWA